MSESTGVSTSLVLRGLDPASASARVLRLVDRWRWGLWALMAALHGAAFTGRWRPGGDSAALLVLGERLREHGDLVTMTGYGEGVMPGYLWVLSVLGGVFGTPVFGALIVNLCAVVLWWVLVFLAVRKVLDRATAVLVVLLCGVSARAMEAGADVLPGMLFAAGLAGVLWVATWRGGVAKVVWLGVLLGLMISLRTVGVLVLGALCLSWVVGLWGRRASGGVGPLQASRWRVWVGVGLVVWCLGLVLALPKVGGDAAVLLARLGEGGVWGVCGSVWEAVVWAVPEGVMGLDLSGYVNVFVGPGVLLAGVMLFRVRVFWGLLVVGFALPWLLFVSTPRYVLPVLPLFYVGGWLVLVRMERRWPTACMGWGVLCVCVLVVASNGIGVGRLVGEQRGEPFLSGYRDGKYAAAAEVSAWLSANSLPGSRVLCTADERAAVSWWSGRDALSVVSSPAMNTGMLYAVEPLDDAARAAMEELGWSLGAVLLTAEDVRGGGAWVLREVERGGASRK